MKRVHLYYKFTLVGQPRLYIYISVCIVRDSIVAATVSFLLPVCPSVGPGVRISTRFLLGKVISQIVYIMMCLSYYHMPMCK